MQHKQRIGILLGCTLVIGGCGVQVPTNWVSHSADAITFALPPEYQPLSLSGWKVIAAYRLNANNEKRNLLIAASAYTGISSDVFGESTVTKIANTLPGYNKLVDKRITNICSGTKVVGRLHEMTLPDDILEWTGQTLIYQYYRLIGTTGYVFSYSLPEHNDTEFLQIIQSIWCK